MRWSRTVERHLPQIVLIVDDHRLAVARVPGDAIGGFRARMIEFQVDEAHRGLADANGPRGGRIEIVCLQFFVAPVEEVVAVWRNAERMIAGRRVDHLVLQDQRALARCGVHPVQVCCRAFMVVDVAARVAPHGPSAVHRHVEIAHRRIREADVPVRRHVERLPEREVPILFGADHLHRLHALVDRVPDVHVGDLVGVPPSCRVGRSDLLLHPEEHALLVVAPRERRPIADHPPFLETSRLGGIEDDGRRVLVERRLHVRKRDQEIVLLPHLLDVLALEHRKRRPVLAPREACVGAGVVVERVQFPVPQIEDEQAVAVLCRGVDGEGQQLARLVERDVADAAEQQVTPRREIVDGDIHSRRPRGWSALRRRPA